MSEPAARRSAPSPRFVVRSVIWIFILALLLFVPAGTLRWPGAWAFLAIMAVAGFGGVEWLRRHDPELLRERLKPPFQRDQKPWDKVLMATFLPLWFAWFVLMAIDRRFGWSDVPVFAEVLGAVLVMLGMLLGFRVLKENSYAAPVVKLQKDRGHRVVSTGALCVYAPSDVHQRALPLPWPAAPAWLLVGALRRTPPRCRARRPCRNGGTDAGLRT